MRCTSCGHDKDKAEFPPKRGRQCRSCVAEYMRRYAEKNRERLAAYKAEWQQKNADACKAKWDEWRRANLDKCRARSAKQRRERAENLRADQARWHEAHPGVKAAWGSGRRRSLEDRTPSPLTERDRREIERCYATAASYRYVLGEDFHVDYVIPLRGRKASGLHVPWNLRIVRATDSLRKHIQWSEADGLARSETFEDWIGEPWLATSQPTADIGQARGANPTTT